MARNSRFLSRKVPLHQGTNGGVGCRRGADKRNAGVAQRDGRLRCAGQRSTVDRPQHQLLPWRALPPLLATTREPSRADTELLQHRVTVALEANPRHSPGRPQRKLLARLAGLPPAAWATGSPGILGTGGRWPPCKLGEGVPQAAVID